MADSGKVKAGEAYVELGLRDRLQRGLAAARARIMSFGRAVGIAMKAAAAGVTALAGALTGVGVAVVALSKQYADAGKQISDLTKRSRLDAESLQLLGAVAEKTGGDMEVLADAAREMNLRIGEALVTGTGPAIDALNELGISLDDIRKMDTEQRLLAISDALSRIDRSRADFLGEELMGGDFERLAPMLMQGAEAISEARGELDKFRVVMDDLDIAKATQLEQTMSEFWAAVRSAGEQLSSTLQPLITRGFEKARDFVVEIAEKLNEWDFLLRNQQRAWKVIGLEIQRVRLQLEMAIEKLATMIGGSAGARGFRGAIEGNRRILERSPFGRRGPAARTGEMIGRWVRGRGEEVEQAGSPRLTELEKELEAIDQQIEAAKQLGQAEKDRELMIEKAVMAHEKFLDQLDEEAATREKLAREQERLAREQLDKQVRLAEEAHDKFLKLLDERKEAEVDAAVAAHEAFLGVLDERDAFARGVVSAATSSVERFSSRSAGAFGGVGLSQQQQALSVPIKSLAEETRDQTRIQTRMAEILARHTRPLTDAAGALVDLSFDWE